MASIVKRMTGSREARYDVRWRLRDGTVRTKTFRRRADADAYRRKVEADELVGVVTDNRRGTATLASVADAWLASTPTKRASSAARDRSILQAHVLPVLGTRQLRSLTPADVQAFVDGLRATHAPSTVARIHSCLRAVLSYAERAEMIARNPTRHTRLPRVHLVERTVLEPEQIERLVGALGFDQATFMWLGLALGLRWSEAAALRVGRVDFLHHTITVAEQLGRDLRTGPPKSDAGRRTLTAPAWLIEDLAALLARHGLDGGDPSALVFQATGGAPLHYSNWRQRVWLPATLAAGVAGLRFHDLRSNAATALVATGVDVKTAQTRLGHSSPMMTLGVYARATAEADRRAADAIGRRFRPRDARAMEAESTSAKTIRLRHQNRP